MFWYFLVRFFCKYFLVGVSLQKKIVVENVPWQKTWWGMSLQRWVLVEISSDVSCEGIFLSHVSIFFWRRQRNIQKQLAKGLSLHAPLCPFKSFLGPSKNEKIGKCLSRPDFLARAELETQTITQRPCKHVVPWYLFGPREKHPKQAAKGCPFTWFLAPHKKCNARSTGVSCPTFIWHQPKISTTSKYTLFLCALNVNIWSSSICINMSSSLGFVFAFWTK